jgi:CheY-like chemotaxis protein
LPVESLASITPLQSRVILASSADDPDIPSHSKPKRERQHKKKAGDRVLVVGRFRELALYRAEVLGRAGFKVSTADDVDDAIRMMQRGAFDAVVLSYTLPNDTAEYLATMARDYGNGCPIVAIADAEAVDARIAPDAVAYADEGPTGLVSALRRVLQIN